MFAPCRMRCFAVVPLMWVCARPVRKMLVMLTLACCHVYCALGRIVWLNCPKKIVTYGYTSEFRLKSALPDKHTHTHTRARRHVHMHIHRRKHRHKPVCMHACMHALMDVRMCECIYQNMYFIFGKPLGTPRTRLNGRACVAGARPVIGRAHYVSLSYMPPCWFTMWW